ncbi:MAG TPA: signal peptidase I [Blastocatellia bacterium]|jgi:signal peptidase I|nr:signal peptidase I [Blastocatellia bacterium]HAF24308.1 signal peptidase I [Blastocatellia bacterium]
MLGIRTRRPPPFGGVHITDDKDIQIHRPEEASRNSLWAEGRLLLRDLVFALMIAALIVVFIVQPVKVEGTSMLPRLQNGERIFVNKLIYYDEYRWAPRIERGDIVVFWFPDDPSKSYIKRVVGLPGDTVEVREGIVRINGSELNEKYLDPKLNLSSRSQAPVLVRPNYYFVMGDNRDNSFDSRSWGLVPKKYIYGKALFRYWPLSAASIIHHENISPAVPPPSAYHPNLQEIPSPAEER